MKINVDFAIEVILVVFRVIRREIILISTGCKKIPIDGRIESMNNPVAVNSKHVIKIFQFLIAIFIENDSFTLRTTVENWQWLCVFSTTNSYLQM